MKYIIKPFLPIIILLLLQWRLESQMHGLTIGDRIPDISFRILSGNAQSQRLSMYAGKLIILDLWGTYCSSCIEAMPKMEMLQKKYNNHLQVLMVTDQSKELVKHFLDKREQLTKSALSLTFITGDTLFNQLFPHESVPHYIWINRNGVVLYITRTDAVNDENISAVLRGSPISPGLKDDNNIPVNSFRPLFVDQNGGNGNQLMFYSVVSSYVKGIPSISGIFNNKAGDRSIAVGFSQTIKELFQIAYNDFINQWHVPVNRTILVVSDTSKYVFSINGIHHLENFYNYQLICPPRPYVVMQHMMQEDLKKYFNMDAWMEKTTATCWVLRSLDTCLIVSKGGPVEDERDASLFSLRMKNVSITDLQRRLIYNLLEASPYPFVDETKIKGRLDLVLENITTDNVNSIVQALKKYKLQLALEVHEINRLVIKEKLADANTIKNSGDR